MYDMDSEDEPGVKVSVLGDRIDSENKQLIADDKVVFETADLNKDEQLDREEFVLFISPEEHPIMLPIILNQTLRDKDIDNDGVISFQEFLGDSARDHDKNWLIAEKERFDSEYDKDGDGLLNGNEILSWIVPSNEYVCFCFQNNRNLNFKTLLFYSYCFSTCVLFSFSYYQHFFHIKFHFSLKQ